uniref:Uncharacterized protein n=1 Tax=Barley aphid RNA virus 2 isolate HP1 TaxID=2961862 RepID=A0A976X7J0_9VIRU|nr:hypothetical protein 1 [Barley aphid RNA virus 2 isolate HP1]
MFRLIIISVSSLCLTHGAPINSKTTTLRNLNTTFPGIFQHDFLDNIDFYPSNKYTQFIAPKIQSKCMYASVENFLTESNYVMPQECGLVATMTIHDSMFTKSIVDIGTFACTQYHRSKCNPPMHLYTLNYTEDIFVNDILTYYSKETITFRYAIDKTLINYIIVLKDEYTGMFYWITSYCLKYMTVTSDNKFVHLGPGIHHYDAATKQFCITDYSNMCTPVGPFKTKSDFILSLPLEITISSDRPYFKYFEKHTYDDTVKHTIPYDDNNRFEFDKNDYFVYVAGNIRSMQPNYQCVKYHFVPMSSIFHIDIIIDSIEKKVTQYFHLLANFVYENIHDIVEYVENIGLLVCSYIVKKIIHLITRIAAFSFLTEAFIIAIFMMATNYNYTAIICVVVTFCTLKKWLFMW